MKNICFIIQKLITCMSTEFNRLNIFVYSKPHKQSQETYNKVGEKLQSISQTSNVPKR